MDPRAPRNLPVPPTIDATLVCRSMRIEPATCTLPLPFQIIVTLHCPPSGEVLMQALEKLPTATPPCLSCPVPPKRTPPFDPPLVEKPLVETITTVLTTSRGFPAAGANAGAARAITAVAVAASLFTSTPWVGIESIVSFPRGAAASCRGCPAGEFCNARPMDLLVKRDDLHRCRVVDPPQADPGPGEALLSIDSFGLTSNNVTYAVMGEAMSYWDFFAAEEGWGRIPVWGFATVASSAHEDLPEGTRVYGYLPMSSSLLLTPEGVGERGFVDASPHRASLPSTYNAYSAVATDPLYDPEHEAEQMLLRPLFATSFLIDDFLAEEGLLEAGRVILASASSKTALSTAFLLSRRPGVQVVGLTSPGNLGFVEGLGVYDQAVTYEAIETLSRDGAVYVDMSGDAAVRGAVHRHLGGSLAHSAIVGVTHWERAGVDPGEVPGPEPALFFAPDRARKRSSEWGADGLEARIAEAWRSFLEWTEGWLATSHESGFEAIERTYLELLDGRIDPARGHLLSPR